MKEALYPAIDRLLGLLSDEYLAEAPEAAGLYQYPGGEAYYRYLIRRETSLNLTPDQIHEIGLRAVAGIQQEMQTVRQQLGFAGTAAITELRTGKAVVRWQSGGGGAALPRLC